MERMVAMAQQREISTLTSGSSDSGFDDAAATSKAKSSTLINSLKKI
jgi:hypothetical protein